MLSGQEENRATFPPPPPFYRLFVSRSADDAPPEDRFLYTPPPPPPDEIPVTKFGMPEESRLTPLTLPDGVPQLYSDQPTLNHGQELRKLNKAVLDKYIQLLQALIDRPAHVEQSLTELGHVFLNITHLLALCRPHQARQSVVVLLRSQIKTRLCKAEDLERRVREAKEFLQQHGVAFDADGNEIILPEASKPQTTAFSVVSSRPHPNVSSSSSSLPQSGADPSRILQLRTELDALNPHM
eukprot:gb/GEZN01014305.1/.p1 GENE.gb/GEZN01014305.1/~~gb/GEZN01014305.1/.p1  ORF type:complete len:240 (-),score=55.06 gb/GEZN01014305.1/:113-832(-)